MYTYIDILWDPGKLILKPQLLFYDRSPPSHQQRLQALSLKLTKWQVQLSDGGCTAAKPDFKGPAKYGVFMVTATKYWPLLAYGI